MTHAVKRSFQSWGRISQGCYDIAVPAFRDELPALVMRSAGQPTLAVGLGRSYGDSCLNSGGSLIEMTRLNRIITADFNAGIMHVEAGISLDELLRVIVPRGWFVSTTPGTRFVTIGGAVANDVHGKNHHGAGSFGCAVRRLELIRSDGTRVELSASAASPLFRATVGGLGLTGVISTVEFQLTPIRSAYLDVERIPFGHVREFFEINAESVQHFEHTVAWVDCANGRLGRGIMQRARWCTDGDLATHRSSSALSIPSRMPRLVPQRLALKIFNALYYHLNTIGRTR